MRRWLAAGLAALAFPAAAGQFTDLWWNPQESGWGMNLVQQGENAFVTLFVYGPDGKPAWYVSSDASITGYNTGALPLFRGTLYRTEGPWFGGAFDPSKVQVTAVGEMWIETLAKDRVRLSYTAEGTQVTKELRRQTVAPLWVTTWYVSQFVLRLRRDEGPPFATSHYLADLLLHLEDGQGYLRADDHLGGRCEYRGPYEQTGRIIRFWGEFTCTTGDLRVGTFDMSELEPTNNGLTGSIRKFANSAQGGQLEAFGRFAATPY